MKLFQSGFQATSLAAGGIVQIVGGGFLCCISLATLITAMVTSQFFKVSPLLSSLPVLLILFGAALIFRGIARLSLSSRFRKLTALDTPPGSLTALAQELNRTPVQLLADLRTLHRKNCLVGLDVQKHRLILRMKGRDPIELAPDKGLEFAEESAAPVAPVYAIGAVWAVYASLFPLYRWTDLIIAGAASAIAYLLLSRCMPRKVRIAHRKPLPQNIQIKTGDQQMDELLRSAVSEWQTLDALDLSFAQEPVQLAAQKISAATRQILDFLQKKPKKVRQVRQFLHYYLPSTVKMLSTYVELGTEPVQGASIVSSMKKIEDCLPGIVDTFSAELDGLYRDQAIDISAEVSVMRNMIVQEEIDTSPKP